MSRAVKEWIGKNDDAMPPPSVRLRIFRNANSTCHLTGEPIKVGDKWALDHVKAIILGGENRESNLRPALDEAHKNKTATEVAVRAKADAIAKKNLGIAAPKQKIQSPGFRGPNKEEKRASKNAFYHQLTRRPIFVNA